MYEVFGKERVAAAPDYPLPDYPLPDYPLPAVWIPAAPDRRMRIALPR